MCPWIHHAQAGASKVEKWVCKMQEETGQGNLDACNLGRNIILMTCSAMRVYLVGTVCGEERNVIWLPNRSRKHTDSGHAPIVPIAKQQ